MQTLKERKAELAAMPHHDCKVCDEHTPEAFMLADGSGVCDTCHRFKLTTPQIMACAAWVGLCLSVATGGGLF
jgi:hypothetical protein